MGNNDYACIMNINRNLMKKYKNIKSPQSEKHTYYKSYLEYFHNIPTKFLPEVLVNLFFSYRGKKRTDFY